MNLKFLGANKNVTGSCFLLKTKKKNILIDCGIFQGYDVFQRNYEDLSFDPKEVDFVLITHSHLDHIGRLPKLVKGGFKGKIISTAPTKNLAPIMLEDSYYIMKGQAKSLGKEPFFGRKDLRELKKLWEPIDYDEKVKLSPNIECRFINAGHILGSATIEVWVKEGNKKKKIVFSGDLGNPPVPLLDAPQFVKEADYVVLESTYGDRVHEDREERKELLENAIEDVITSKGTLMIPTFALERSQEILYELNSLVENHRIPQIPIFIDSPLAIKALDVYKEYPELYNKKASYLVESGDDLFQFKGLKLCETTEESKKINNLEPPKVIIAGSGMSTGGRILHHEIRYLSDPQNCLLIICYQAEGTLGRKIFDGAQKVDIFGESIPVNCRVEAIGGYSSHADQPRILDWVKKIEKPIEKIFMVHGERKASEELAQITRDKLAISTTIPDFREEFSL